MKTAYKQSGPDEAAAYIASEMQGTAFIIYCADDAHFATATERLHELLPDTKMIGTTGFMLNETGSFAEGITALGFMEDEVEVYVDTLRHADTYPIKYLQSLKDCVDKIHHKYKNTLCFEFSTGYEEKIVSTMKICLEAAGVRLLGGTAGNTGEGQPKKVACNGEVLTDAVAYAVIGSKLGKIEIVKENLFRSRTQTHVVTRVSEDNRTVFEIDNRKAIDVYKEELGYSDADIADGVFKNPLCRIVGADNYITAIFSFNADGSISTYKNLQKNDLICFTNIEEDYQGYIENTVREATKSHDVAGIISINCILRYLFFEKSAYTSSYAKMMRSMSNNVHFGIISDGEQYVDQHVNQTMVCAIFTKGQ